MGSYPPYDASYRYCFTQHLVADPLGQALWRKNVNVDAEQPFRVDLDGRERHQGGMRRGIDQQVKVTVLCIVTVGRATKHTRMQYTVSQDDLPQPCSVQPQCF